MARNELKSFLPPATTEKMVVTREMVAGLPPVVQKWLDHSNIIGKEFVQTIHLRQKGKMCTVAGGKWMPFEAEQYFTTQKPGFIWFTEVKAAPGIHLAGRDKYEDGKGHMLIKLLSLFPVADAKGKEIDQGAMVRYLAEIVWFPSTALSNYIQWEKVDSTTAKATMTYRRKNGIRKKAPWKIRNEIKTAIPAAANRRVRTMDKSTTGCTARLSTAMKSVRKRIKFTAKPTVNGDVHPHDRP
jgi:hypothetical protein